MSDPLDRLTEDLRNDWKALEARAPVLRDELSTTDQDTQAAVRWMQCAWGAMDTAEAVEAGSARRSESVPPLPIALARLDAQRRANGRDADRGTRRRRVVAGAAVMIAAATLLAVTLLRTESAGQRERQNRPHGVGQDTGRQASSAGSTAHAANADVPRVPRVDLELLRAASRLTEFQPDEIVPREDGVEIVTGNVRIVLLNNQETNRPNGE